jgi:TonB family protein
MSGMFLKAQTETFVVPDSLPVFDGGTTSIEFYISASVNYPAESREFKQQGKVFVSFIIDTGAQVRNPEVLRSSGHAALDKEALRVTQSLPFTRPAIHQGEKVPYKMTIPINFKIDDAPHKPNYNANAIAYCSPIESYPSDEYYLKGNKFFEEGKFYDALENLRIYTKHYPKDFETVTKLGVCYIKTRQQEKGCALLAKVQKQGSAAADKDIKQYCTK